MFKVCEMYVFNKFRRWHIFIKDSIRAFFGIFCDICLLQGYTLKTVRLRALLLVVVSLKLPSMQTYLALS